MEVITLVVAKKCAGCGGDIPVGSEAKYYNEQKIYHHPACPKKGTSSKQSASTAQVVDLLKQIHDDLMHIGDILERRVPPS